MSSAVPLGMPAMPGQTTGQTTGPAATTTAPTWKQAWDAALYGADGFYRRQSPAAHFRTSVHASPLFAEALVGLVREAGMDTVVDVGAGRGELLTRLRAIDKSLTLLGVEVAPRPRGLDGAIDWTAALPESVEGLLIANEWLDNVPCHVAEVDGAGTPRLVHVDPATGTETLGAAVDDPSVPPGVAAWLSRWWPLAGAVAGRRAEIGTSRDGAWADAVRRVRRGLAIAVDYGHRRDDRPPLGSLRSYRSGHEVDPLPDGTRDLTAHVAVDSVADSVSGRVVAQRAALRALGVRGDRPDLALAAAEPARYARELARATEAAELTAEHGLGGFFWIVSATDGLEPLWLSTG